MASIGLRVRRRIRRLLPAGEEGKLWIALTLCGGVAGFLVNLISFGVCDRVELRFGGILTSVVMLALGPAAGALANAMAYSRPVWESLDWYPAAMAIAEAVVLGAIARRHRDPQGGDPLFWGALLFPLIASLAVFAIPGSAAYHWATVAKQPLNGIFNVAIAVLLLGITNGGEPLGIGNQVRHLRSVRLYVLSGVIVAAAAPVMVLMVRDGRDREEQIVAAESRMLAESAEVIAMRVDEHVGKHRKAVSAIAASLEQIGALDSATAQAQILRQHAIHRGFLTMLIADTTGRVTASSPAFTEDGRPFGRTAMLVNDREYFKEPIRTGAPYVSEAAAGSRFGGETTVAASDVIRGPDGRVFGIVQGTLDLQQLDLQRLWRSDRDVLIVDRNERVLYGSPGSGFETLQDLRTSGFLRAVSKARGPIAYREEGSPTKLASGARAKSLGWRVVVSSRLDGVVESLAVYYRAVALWSLLIVAIALFLGRFVAAAVTRPLDVLLEHANRISDRPAEFRAIALPRDTPFEAARLGTSLAEMSEKLVQSYRSVSESLEERIRLNQELTRMLVAQKRNAAELKSARDRAEEGSRVKTSFLNNLSHELRTPMNGFLGMLTLLLDGELSPEQRQRAQTAYESATALRGVVNDLLSFAPGIETVVERIEFYPSAVVDAILATYSKRAAERGLKLTAEVHPLAKRKYRGDPGKVREVLGKLVDNGIKFTEHGSVHISLQAHPQPDRTMQFRFEVRDTGTGVPREIRTKLFLPFSQADESLTRRHGGAGLGLALARQTVERIGGRIGYQEKEGPGATFWFEIRMEAVEAAIRELSGQTRRVLIVEDNPVNQKVAAKLVERAGFETEVARNGRLALEALEKQSFDAILMDCQMPEMDGYQATAEIRRREQNVRHTPIIAMTAHAMDEDRQRCFTAGMDDYLSKPVSKDDLWAVLKRWTARRDS